MQRDQTQITFPRPPLQALARYAAKTDFRRKSWFVIMETAATSCRAPSKFDKYESGKAALVWNLLDFPTHYQHLRATVASVRNNAEK